MFQYHARGSGRRRRPIRARFALRRLRSAYGVVARESEVVVAVGGRILVDDGTAETDERDDGVLCADEEREVTKSWFPDCAG